MACPLVWRMEGGLSLAVSSCKSPCKDHKSRLEHSQVYRLPLLDNAPRALYTVVPKLTLDSFSYKGVERLALRGV